MKNDFPELLTSFFSRYLVLQKGVSDHTIASYRDAFLLMFSYYKEAYGIPPDKITFGAVTRDAIMDFCQWLETSRGSCTKTRNLRLTAIHSFFRYVEMQEPALLALCRGILDIPMKKCEKKAPVHLSDIEMKMLLSEPDTKTKEGIRDLAIIAVLYDTGTRVSELIGLKAQDIRIGGGTATVVLTGKGRKMRIVPISSPTAGIIKAYIRSNKVNPSDSGSTLFTNARGTPLTRPGVNYILNKYVQRAKANNPGYFNLDVTAHVIRHTKAVNLLMSDINLVYIRDFLGHASVVTTEHYARTNPEFLRRAIERNAQNYIEGVDQFDQREKETLTEFLKSFRK